MLFQKMNPALLLLWIILAIIVVTLIIYLAVKVIESKYKASDKKWVILLIAFLAVVVVPIILGFINLVLSALGNGLASLRNIIDGGGRNYLTSLTAIIGFIIILVLIKFLIDLPWESSLWIALLTLFVIYIILTLIPELYIINIRKKRM